MSGAIRDQHANGVDVHRVNCDDCGAFLIHFPGELELPIFLRDCPHCGADVLQQPAEKALQEWADSYGVPA